MPCEFIFRVSVISGVARGGQVAQGGKIGGEIYILNQTN
jgi:hypothetical protein